MGCNIVLLPYWVSSLFFIFYNLVAMQVAVVVVGVTHPFIHHYAPVIILRHQCAQVVYLTVEFSQSVSQSVCSCPASVRLCLSTSVYVCLWVCGIPIPPWQLIRISSYICT